MATLNSEYSNILIHIICYDSWNMSTKLNLARLKFGTVPIIIILFTVIDKDIDKEVVDIDKENEICLF